MKKLLSIMLVLVLALGLAVPSLAVGSGQTVVYPKSGREAEEYNAYVAEHPEELAALDISQSLADWGYQTMTAEEQFMEYAAYEGESLEEAVMRQYVVRRVHVTSNCERAQEYKAEYPQEWENFDADAYFEAEYGSSYEDKEKYCATWNIFNEEKEEKFVDQMFAEYIYATYLSEDYDWNYSWDDPEEEPTLTLYVNGVATEVELTAGDGATYADADALRQILGPDAVSTDQTGPVAIRPAAEAAGWDVGWYSSWWGNRQEVQLWDKAGFEGFLNEEFAPLNEFLAKAMEQSKDLLFSEKATAGHETVTVDLKRFSTLDGDKDYKLTLAVDYIVQNGVMDMTCTFDLSQLLQLFDGNDLKTMTKAGGFTPTQLSSLLRAGKAEVILDYNEGMVAYNVPLLALFDEDRAGWQSEYVPGLDTVMDSYEEMGEAAFTSTLYAQMLTTAGYSGAEYAFEQYDQSVSLLTLFAGKDRFTTKNGKTTYSFTTEGVNAALAALLAQTSGVEETELAGSSFFKACDLTYTLDSSGNVTMEAHVRPDREGITAAMAAVNEEMDPYYTYGTAMAMKWMLSFFDMDITASARGNQSRATQRVDVHWNNVGKLSVNATTTTQTTTKAPRQVEDMVNAE